MSDSILQQQIDYYRARAAEYDEWFYRHGRYDRGPEANKQWFAEVETVREALADFKPAGKVLELASGTGLWTAELLKHPLEMTCVDASPEMIAIHQAKLQNPQITYIQADLFQWQPEDQYDMVFFSFWLSHVPAERLIPFLQTVRKALKPDGRVFILDSRRTPTSTAKDHIIPDSVTVLERKLNDGKIYQIVKVFYTPEMLQDALVQADLHAEIRQTPEYFIYAVGS
ncbi:MAG: class I SAM-dependent methyltransferase [Anaerolineae bacterium]|nr:class I SAM-dependent methyltransferase [Anaerolineae bacterium]